MEVAKKLNGIFTVWDGRQDALFLYRDQLGIKLLFYAVEGSTLVFSSEPKALFAHPGSPLCGPGALPLSPHNTYLGCDEVTLPICWRTRCR